MLLLDQVPKDAGASGFAEDTLTGAWADAVIAFARALDAVIHSGGFASVYVHDY